MNYISQRYVKEILQREVAQNRAQWRSAITQTFQPMLAWTNYGIKNDDDDDDERYY